MPWLRWEQLFWMLCMMWKDKGSSLNLDLMISSTYIMIIIMMIFIYVHMYVCFAWQSRHVSWLFNANVYMHICVYVCRCLIGSWFFYDNVYVYVCIYPCIYVSVQQGCQGSFLWRNDRLCKWMAWIGSWFMKNQVGRVVMEIIWGQYHVVMSWYYVIMLCLCYGYAIPRDTSAKWK